MIHEEYERVKGILSRYISTKGGRKLLSHLKPKEAPDFTYLRKLIHVVEEQGIDVFVEDVEDIEDILKRSSSGFTLTPEQLLKVAHFIRTSLKIYERLLGTYLQDIVPDPKIVEYLSKRILRTITEDGYLKDQASDRLANLRQKKRSLRKQLLELYEKLLDRFSAQGYLRERKVVLKGGRMVLPVLSHVSMEGIVHGYSHTTETVFVEPMEVVELQNRYVRVIHEEQEEERRILSELSSIIGRNANYLLSIYQGISHLDLLLAKYRFMKDYRAVIPEITSSRKIIFRKLYHPLLVDTKGFDGTVPLTLELESKALLITGPNAGGKTVALKTIALAFMLAKSEIPIPAEFVSIYLPKGIHEAGFEDTQSIEEGLSSFTSYMRSIKYILENAQEGDVVFLDEFLSSTDPYEASALAYAILRELLSRNILVFANTHLAPLKQLCMKDEDVEIGAMEYDPIENRPTYNLILGKVGESYALQIARSVGIPSRIVEQAQNILVSITGELEQLRRKLEDELRKVASLRKELEEERRKLETKKQVIIDQAKVKAQSIVKQAEREVKRILKEFKNRAETNVSEAYRTAKMELRSASPQLETIEDVRIGEEYYLVPFMRKVKVVSTKGNRVVVLLNDKYMEVPKSSLRRKI